MDIHSLTLTDLDEVRPDLVKAIGDRRYAGIQVELEELKGRIAESNGGGMTEAGESEIAELEQQVQTGHLAESQLHALTSTAREEQATQNWEDVRKAAGLLPLAD